MRFIEDLPHKLKVEIAMIMHRKMYIAVHFFKDKDKSFLAWVSTLLRPTNVEEGRYIYKEGEEITESKRRMHGLLFVVFFLVKGACGYVLPRYENKAYLQIQEGKHFGHVELAADKSLMDEDGSFTIMRRS